MGELHRIPTRPDKGIEAIKAEEGIEEAETVEIIGVAEANQGTAIAPIGIII